MIVPTFVVFVLKSTVGTVLCHLHYGVQILVDGYHDPSRHTLPILWSECSPDSFASLSSSRALLFISNLLVASSYLILMASSLVFCWLSSTYPVIKAIIRPEFSRIIQYFSDQSCITMRATDMAT